MPGWAYRYVLWPTNPHTRCPSRIHRAADGRATSGASCRRFWAMAARTNSSRTPRGPRSRSRLSLSMCFKCANRISIFQVVFTDEPSVTRIVWLFSFVRGTVG